MVRIELPVRAGSVPHRSRGDPDGHYGYEEKAVHGTCPSKTSAARAGRRGFESHPTTAVPPLAVAHEAGVTENGPHLRPDLVPSRRPRAALPSPAVPPTCPRQQSTAVTKGQHRSTGEVADLRYRWTASSPTVLPKLAVISWPWSVLVRTLSGTAGQRRARAVTTGMAKPQVARVLRPMTSAGEARRRRVRAPPPAATRPPGACRRGRGHRGWVSILRPSWWPSPPRQAKFVFSGSALGGGGGLAGA
jgi:hypothetical protein